MARWPRSLAEGTAVAARKVERRDAELEPCVLLLGQGEGRLGGVVRGRRRPPSPGRGRTGGGGRGRASGRDPPRPRP